MKANTDMKSSIALESPGLDRLRSLRLKLTLFFVVVTTATMGLAGFFGHQKLAKELNQEFEQLQVSTLSRLADSTAIPVWDMDAKVVDTILKVEQQNRAVVSIQVFDRKGVLFSQTGTAQGIVRQADIFRADKDANASGSAPQAPVGKVVVAFTRIHLEDSLQKSLQSVFLQIVTIDAVMLLLLMFGLRRVFTPLAHLSDAMKGLVDSNSTKGSLRKLPDSSDPEFSDVVLSDLPADYLHIASGLGTAAPRCVLAAPVLLPDGEIAGVIELALLAQPGPRARALFDELLPQIAIAISILQNNQRAALAGSP